ncbi:DUF975 family protein [Streptococcus sp. CSL10205-OR2]|uniref:DUF975 family protein n=1 Tax=Streptococcus sp. CSL10205-OR2 TaxID=2980558 RepID=UPI0021DA7E6D|nr:DUF975 family protein [Streptococcus sp. CSL10205-OR2]MCU9533157.1 DUF975 family protein [Streptococcus sp. CSL10205-OR2]
MKPSIIKKEARTILKRLPGKYQLFLLPILSTLFYMGVTVFEQLTLSGQTRTSWGDNLFTLALSTLVTFFVLSTLLTLLDVIRGKRQSVRFSDSQRAFETKLFLPLFGLMMMKNLLLFVWFFASSVGYIMILTSGVSLTGVVLVLLSLIMFLITLYRYFFVELLFYEYYQKNVKINPLVLLATSRQFMKGYKRQLFFLHLSFIGWYVLVGVTFGLASFYVLPYLLTSNTIFYEKMLQEKRQLQKMSFPMKLM